jgi:hypothetical protein
MRPADARKKGVYCTSYCNQGHRLSDGRPIAHECAILPPAALQAEREGRTEDALEIIAAHKPLRTMRRGVRSEK